MDEIKNFLEKQQTQKFDIIFFDPPFAEKGYVQELKIIKQKNISKKNHIVIIHRESKSSENLKNILNPLIIKKYGRSKIIFGNLLG